MTDERAVKGQEVDESLQNKAKVLGERDRRYAEEYVACKFNATKAAKAAGYSEWTGRRKATAWLNPESPFFKPRLKAYVDALMDNVAKTLKITAEEVLDELTHVARGNLADVISCGSIEEIAALPREVQKCIKSFSTRLVDTGKKDESGKIIKERVVKIELKDDVAANRLLGQYFKLWVERTEHTEVQTFADKQLERTKRFGPLKAAGHLKSVS